MVEISSSFFVGFSIIFGVLLAVILYGSRGPTVTVKPKKEKKQKEKKDQAPKKKEQKRKAPKRDNTPASTEPAKKYVIDPKAEQREVLEFLKGKDKSEIVKLLQQEEKKAKKGGNNKKIEDDTPSTAQPSRTINEKEAKEFTSIKSKPKKEKAAKEETVEAPTKKGGNKSFFKADEDKKKQEYEDRQKEKEQRKKEKEERERRKAAGEPEDPEQKKLRLERKAKRLEQEKADRLARGEPEPEVEPVKARERYSKYEDYSKQVKYEQADIGDLLNNMGKFYNDEAPKPKEPKPRQPKESKPRGPRFDFTVKDLASLAQVDKQLSEIVANAEGVWQFLYTRDFKNKPTGVKNWREAYENEFKANGNVKNAKTNAKNPNPKNGGKGKKSKEEVTAESQE